MIIFCIRTLYIGGARYFFLDVRLTTITISLRLCQLWFYKLIFKTKGPIKGLVSKPNKFQSKLVKVIKQVKK